MNLNGEEYYYIRNGQGDIIGLFDSDGTEVVRYYYDSWGKLISIEGTLKDTIGVKNPYRYRGYRYDRETGLYYLQSRYYNPEWCRFINADGFLGIHGMLLSHNLFAYCQNDPVNNSDSSGYIFDIFLDILSMAQSIIDIVKNPTSGKAWAALGLDIVFAAVPGATGGGLMVRAESKVEKVADVAKVADKGSYISKGTSNLNKISDVTQTTRRKAFRDAKRKTSIPTSAQYKKHKYIYDKTSENRWVYEFDVNGSKKYIIEHFDDKFGRGPHFHGADGLRGNPFDKGRYNQYPGHFPEDFSGYGR